MISKLADLELQTERLRIRVIQDHDLRSVYPIHTDDLVNRHLPYDTWQNWDDAKHWYAKQVQRRNEGIAEQFVIEASQDGQLVGTCIAFDYDNTEKSIEFGYVLARNAWKQGFMQEAMSEFIPALQRRLDLALIIASVERENTASLKLLEKFDFEHVDTIVEDDGLHLFKLHKKFQ